MPTASEASRQAAREEVTKLSKEELTDLLFVIAEQDNEGIETIKEMPIPNFLAHFLLVMLTKIAKKNAEASS